MWERYYLKTWRRLLFDYWKKRKVNTTYYQRTLKFHRPIEKTYMEGFDHGKYLFIKHMNECQKKQLKPKD